MKLVRDIPKPSRGTPGTWSTLIFSQAFALPMNPILLHQFPVRRIARAAERVEEVGGREPFCPCSRVRFRGRVRWVLTETRCFRLLPTLLRATIDGETAAATPDITHPSRANDILRGNHDSAYTYSSFVFGTRVVVGETQGSLRAESIRGRPT